MAAGDLKRPTKMQHAAIDAAVARAEAITGLQFCVYMGPVDDDRPREHAEAMFAAGGMHERPAVLVVVAPRQRRVEVVTGPHALGRISDDAAADSVATMTAAFGTGDLAGGLIAGIEHLAVVAGPGERPVGEKELPNLLDG